MRTRIEILARELFPGGRREPVLLGVSGGPDSLCLGHVLASLGYRCTWAYFDHSLRYTSQAEGEAVERMAREAGADFVRGQGAVEAYAQEGGLSIEEAGRSLRYQFLFEQAQAQQAQAVAVAHNANDQVETLLMHLLRGAGLDGLSGMAFSTLPNPWSAELPLVRPLLSTWREEIEAYLKENHLEPVLDPSNQDTRFFRNRLRHELVPFLETYNPHIQTALWQTADLLNEDRRVLDAQAQRAWEQCVTWEEPGAVALDAVRLGEAPRGLQRRVLRIAIQKLRPSLRDIDYAAVQRALEFAAAPPANASADLAAGLRLEWEEGWVWLAEREKELPALGWPQFEGNGLEQLPTPGEMLLPGSWRLQAEVVEGQAGELHARAQSNPDPYQAWFAAEVLPLFVRARQAGDRFQPLGMEGHSLKLSDLFTNQKVPRRARVRWPLLVSGGAIVWVAGCRQAEAHRVQPDTTRAVHVKLVK
jgi:tRNA(Ile)-lysidine synthase